ncbi:hypothetical protein DICPUDRAFT_147582 [Dictyostelium purpureum]|uniref:Regulator of chromosome condensation domain-containing protein n=1 Tax=Dictyostelium purpureum TaxID=5786 RepID=F0Z8V7_DICPU|nr:uncharacterized protein DICPUDRAFT_147582 [Dictyostelium purpureum]EGC39643.1 hypothetical protein DICPUDRAFT_147582 [Dictyostelium purpureum]|eukprot:XP_003283864.1 hypothetical protein DICPUDRAFT_147582 [Dictyostelium purpureum]
MFKKLDKFKEKISSGVSNVTGSKDKEEITYVIQPADCAQLVGGFGIGLGLNNENQLSQPSPIKECKQLVSIPSTFKLDIANVSLGNEHSFYQTKDGKFFYAGSNKEGQFGTISAIHVDSLTQYNNSQIKFKKIICGQYHTAFISDKGQIYTAGKSDLLGIRSDESKKTPTLIPALADQKIELYATGPRHSFVVTKEGHLYGWGKSDNLGVGSFVKVKRVTTITHEPTIVDTCAAFLSFKIVQIAIGDDHTLALCNNGDVYAWGRGEEFQLGNKTKETRASPILVESLRSLNIISIQCGSFNCSALTDKKECYIWGQYGEDLIATPQPLCPGGSSHPFKVQEISQNGFYNIFTTLDSDIYTFGIDYKMFNKSAWLPLLLKIDDPLLLNKRITQVSASAAGYYVIIYDGSTTLYAEIDYSKKGMKPTKTLSPLPQSQYAKDKEALFGKPSSSSSSSSTNTTRSSGASRPKRDDDDSVL